MIVSKAHIVFFNRSFYPDTAATGQLLTDLCEGLVTRGFRVSVVCGMPLLPSVFSERGKRAHIITREEFRGISIYRARGTTFSKRTFAGRVSNYITYFISACYAGFFVPRPQVVVALTDPPIIGLAGYLLARQSGAAFVMSYKDIFPEVATLLEEFNSKLICRALQVINCFLARHADRVIALGPTMRERLINGKGADPSTTVIIPDWADCSQIVPGKKDNPFSRKHDLTDKFVVMHSGNIGLSQNLETLVHAASYLMQWSDIRVVFVGEGVKKIPLQELARNLRLTNVMFLPFQPQEELTNSFGTADVFVISLKSGLSGYIVPSKLYGVLAAGRPCVVAVEDDSEAALIVQKFNCGFKASVGDPHDLAQQVVRLYQNKDMRDELAHNARTASFAFDKQSQIEAYRDLLSELVCRFPCSITFAIAKRALDLLLSGVGIVASLPLWATIAILIKLDDGGPIFYSQPRVGKYGRLFNSLKFRSMIKDSDQRFGALQAGEDDPRVTRIGRILRGTAMDELPQLLNIFRGDMSFVGPRALMPQETEVHGPRETVEAKYIPGYNLRHLVKPGLTGIAQVYAPRDIPRRYKFRFDRLYIIKRSFFLDVRLILVSFWITFRAKWEYRGAKF